MKRPEDVETVRFKGAGVVVRSRQTRRSGAGGTTGIVTIAGYGGRTPGLRAAVFDAPWAARDFDAVAEIVPDGGLGWKPAADVETIVEVIASHMNATAMDTWLVVAHSAGAFPAAELRAWDARLRAQSFVAAMCPPGGVRLPIRLAGGLLNPQIRAIHKAGRRLASREGELFDLVLQSPGDGVVEPLPPGRTIRNLRESRQHVLPFANLASNAWQETLSEFAHWRARREPTRAQRE